MHNKGDLIRVAFARQSSDQLTALSNKISSAPDFEMHEIIQSPDSIWKTAITISPDVTIYCARRFEDEDKLCIKRILRGSFSYIILICDVAVTDAAIISDEKIYIIQSPRVIADFDDIVEKTRELGESRKNAGRGAKPITVGAGSVVLPDNVLNGQIIALGASTGGTEALAKVFHLLPQRMPGMLVVQHMPPVFTKMYAERLDRELPFSVVEAEDNVPIQPGSIHIAPGNKHLTLRKKGDRYYTCVAGTERVSGHCPSVDVLFDSVAEVAGKKATGVILTGMGADGALGLLHMRQKNAFTIGQDEASSVVYGMPKKAFEFGAVIRQAPLQDIAAVLVKHLSGL